MGTVDTEVLVERMEREIRPLLGKSKRNGGYDCCGCATYDQILDHAIAIVRDGISSWSPAAGGERVSEGAVRQAERELDCEEWAPIDPEALVQTVRNFIDDVPQYGTPDKPWAADLPDSHPASLALDALAHKLKRLKVGRDGTAEAYRELEGELNIAEAELKRQRGYTKDEAVQTVLAKEFGSEQFQRAEAAEAEIERLQNKLNTDSQNFELEARKAQIASLEAELERVKQERDEWKRSYAEEVSRLDAAVERVKAERDYLADRLPDLERARLAAGGCLDKALAALREITEVHRLFDADNIARAAIQEIEGEAPNLDRRFWLADYGQAPVTPETEGEA